MIHRKRSTKELYIQASAQQIKTCQQAYERGLGDVGMGRTMYVQACLDGMISKCRSECAIRDLAWQRYGGQKEIATPIGRIDLLCTLPSNVVHINAPLACLFEAKYAEGFKSALGQALAYAFYKSAYKPCLALIGMTDKQTRLYLPIASAHNVLLFHLHLNGELEIVL